MELPRIKIYRINALITAGGIILLFAGGYIPIPIIRTIIEALGTSAIVTAAINFLDRLITERPEGVGVLANSRHMVPQRIHDRKYRSKHVDLLGVSMTTCLQEFVNDRQADFSEQILLGNDVRFRMLFVHPCSPFLDEREVEDNTDEKGVLKRKNLESVEYCVQLYELLNEQLARYRSMKKIYQPIGHLEIKLINACPYMTIERYDDDLYWGLYMADTEGINSPILSAPKKRNPDMHARLKNHFLGMHGNKFPIPGTPENMMLLTVTMHGVWINKELVNYLIPGRIPVP